MVEGVRMMPTTGISLSLSLSLLLSFFFFLWGFYLQNPDINMCELTL